MGRAIARTCKMDFQLLMLNLKAGKETCRTGKALNVIKLDSLRQKMPHYSSEQQRRKPRFELRVPGFHKSRSAERQLPAK